VVAWNGQKAEKIYVNGVLENDLGKIFGNRLIQQVGRNNWFIKDLWAQDYMEIVNHNRTGAPATRIPNLIDLQDEVDGGVPETIQLFEPSYGSFEVENFGSGGDLEATPPLPNFPLGLVYGGSSTTPDLSRLLKMQRAQLQSNQEIVDVNTKWLRVGHVDEIISFLPAGGSFALAVPSPREAVDIMHNLFQGGNGKAKMRVIAGHTTVEKLLVKDKGKRFTQIATAVDAAATTLVLEEAAFEVGDFLRVDDEYLFVLSLARVGGAPAIVVERAAFERARKPPEGHSQDALIYALTDTVVENFIDSFHGGGEVVNPQARIDQTIGDLIPSIGLNFEPIELPVLFRYQFTSSDLQGWLADTSNLVNCLAANGQVVMPKTFGPMTGNVNHFENAATSKLTATGVVAPVFRGIRLFCGQPLPVV